MLSLMRECKAKTDLGIDRNQYDGVSLSREGEAGLKTMWSAGSGMVKLKKSGERRRLKNGDRIVLLKEINT